MTRPTLRLIADDLTGALDTAAEFSGLCGPVPVRRDGAETDWRRDGAMEDSRRDGPMEDSRRDGGVGAGGSIAWSTGTREAGAEVARARVAALAPALAAGDIAYRKLDSLLRGPVAAELAALWRSGAWAHCVLAPAFPAMGRVARHGVVLAEGAQRPDWAAEGLHPRHGDPSGPLPPGITWFDAASDADLARIVACGRAAPGPVLWAGSGGLARALADVPVPPETALRPPVLGLFGSEQVVTRRQLAACGDAWVQVVPGDAAPVLAALTGGVALVSLALPDGLARDEAAGRIAAGFAALLRGLPRPGTLLVAGGETLASICDALGAPALLAEGLVAPGVPRSRLLGGRWDGLTVISKSGAFGGDALWRDLLAPLRRAA